MKLISAGLIFALIFLWAASLPAAESKQGAPSGTVNMHITKVAFGVGISKGDGTLHYKGHDYKFKVTGLSAMGVGITTLTASGEVYNLKSRDDFAGKYYGAEAGGTFIEGTKGLVVQNSKGVVLNLKAENSGLSLNLGDQGLNISPEWD